MENLCVHELAQKLGQSDGQVSLETAMTGVSVCGLLNAVKDGKITVDQLNGTNGQNITVKQVRDIAGTDDEEIEEALAEALD